MILTRESIPALRRAARRAHRRFLGLFHDPAVWAEPPDRAKRGAMVRARREYQDASMSLFALEQPRGNAKVPG